MAPSGKQLGLNPDELAFYFQSDVGIEAGELGAFLQRAAVDHPELFAPPRRG